MTLYMVELRVADVATSAAWYRRLGFTQTTHDPATGFTLLECASARIALRPGPATPGVILHFEVAELNAFDDVKTSPEGYRRARLTDPDGYDVVLFAWIQRNAQNSAINSEIASITQMNPDFRGVESSDEM